MKYKLKDVCNFYSGTGFPTKYQGEIEGDYPFYKVGDIANNVIAGNIYLAMCNNYVSIDTVKKIKGCVLPPNTVVFAKIGEALKLNRRAITSCACLIDNNAMGIAPKEDTLRIQYFYFFMKNLKMQVLAESTTVPSVRKTILEDYEVEIPSLNIQEEIESRLTIIQDIIEKRKKDLSLLDNLIKARFVEMFGNCKEKCRLSDYAELITKGASPRWQGVEYSDKEEGTLFITSENVREGFIDYTKKKFLPNEINSILPRSVLKRNDVLINIVNASIGRAAIYESDDLANINQAVALIRLKPDVLNLQFLLAFLNSDEAISAYDYMKVGGDKSNLSLKNISDLQIPVAGMDLQNQFADFVHQVDKSKFMKSF